MCLQLCIWSFLYLSRILSHIGFAFKTAVADCFCHSVCYERRDNSHTPSAQPFQAQLFPSTSCSNYWVCPDAGTRKAADSAGSVSREHFCTVPRPLASRRKLKAQSPPTFCDSPRLILFLPTARDTCRVSLFNYLSCIAAFKQDWLNFPQVTRLLASLTYQWPENWFLLCYFLLSFSASLMRAGWKLLIPRK